MGQILVSDMFGLSASAPRYVSIWGGNSVAYSTTTGVDRPISVSGVLALFHAQLNDALTQGQYIFRVWKNGAQTSLTTTISSGESEGYDDSNTVTVEKGDRIYVYAVPSGSPDQTLANVSLVIFPELTWETTLSGKGCSTSNQKVFTPMGSGFTDLATEYVEQFIAAEGVIFTNLIVRLTTAPGAGKSWTFTLRVNEANTDLSVTISGSDTVGEDSAHIAQASAGDRISLLSDPTSSPAATSKHFSVRGVISAFDKFLIGGAATTKYTSGVPQYYPAVGCFGGGKGIPTCYVLANDMILENLKVRLHQAPGSGKNFTVTVMKDTGAGEESTSLTLTFTGDEVEKSITGSEGLSRGDVFYLKVLTDYTTGWTDGFRFGLLAYSNVTPPLAGPTVQTNACTNRALQSLTANGEVLATGGYNCNRRGFCYLKGTGGDPNIFDDDEVHEDGDYGVGAFSLDITSLDSGEPYRVRAYAVNPFGLGYGETVDCAVLSFPSDSMARVSSVRHVYRPGLYRMEVSLGDLGFDVDVVEAAMRKVTEGVAEPEEGEPVEKKEVPTPEEVAKAAEKFKEVSWPKAIESIDIMFPERPPVSGKWTPPAPKPWLGIKPSPEDITVKKKYPFSYEALKYGLQDCQKWGGCKGMTVEQYAASLGVQVPPH